MSNKSYNFHVSVERGPLGYTNDTIKYVPECSWAWRPVLRNSFNLDHKSSSFPGQGKAHTLFTSNPRYGCASSEIAPGHLSKWCWLAWAKTVSEKVRSVSWVRQCLLMPRTVSSHCLMHPPWCNLSVWLTQVLVVWPGSHPLASVKMLQYFGWLS